MIVLQYELRHARCLAERPMLQLVRCFAFHVLVGVEGGHVRCAVHWGDQRAVRSRFEPRGMHCYSIYCRTYIYVQLVYIYLLSLV